MKFIKSRLVLLSLLAVVAYSIVFASMTLAPATINATHDASIRVQISEVTMVDINPQYLDWGTLAPGSNTYTYNATNSTWDVIAEDLTGIVIENVGSTNISRVWFNNTVPAIRPFGTGDIDNYDPVNWLMLAIKNTDRTEQTERLNNFSYINHVEFNETAELLYLQTGALTHDARLRQGNQEYYVAYDGSGSCAADSGNKVFRIGLIHHNETQTGDIDLGVGCDSGSPDNTAGGDSCIETTLVWSAAAGAYIGNLSTGTLSDYKPYNATCIMVENVATEGNCSKITFYTWNPDVDSDDATCTYTEYSWDQPGGMSYMFPGDILTINTQLAVPYGVAYSINGTDDGQTPIIGTLTVLVEYA